jgi:hypothetical protein
VHTSPHRVHTKLDTSLFIEELPKVQEVAARVHLVGGEVDAVAGAGPNRPPHDPVLNHIHLRCARGGRGASHPTMPSLLRREHVGMESIGVTERHRTGLNNDLGSGAPAAAPQGQEQGSSREVRTTRSLR